VLLPVVVKVLVVIKVLAVVKVPVLVVVKVLVAVKVLVFVKVMFIIFFYNYFLYPGTRRVRFSALGIFTLCTLFGRVPGFEPEMLRLQPGVLPLSYTHP